MMVRSSPLYIIASPRPRTGKTLLARLLLEFFRESSRPVVGYDLNPREPALTERFPELVWPIDIAETRGQMELFDRLLADNTSTKVIDLGYRSFDQFFAVIDEIGFVREAQRQLIEPIILFVTDSAAPTARSYAELRQYLAATFVPVHNEAVSLVFVSEDFPPSRAECGVIRIPRLSPIVRGVIDRPSFSFSDFMIERPGASTEMHQWVGEIVTEFREFELRLLMGRLSSSLGGAPAAKRGDGGVGENTHGPGRLPPR
jgi:hypothetical protein